MCVLLIKRLLRLVGRWARKPVNHTSWVAIVTLTDRPKSVRNRCLIELFCGVVCVVTLPFLHFCWCRGFCHRTESDLFLFLFWYFSYIVVFYVCILLNTLCIARHTNNAIRVTPLWRRNYVTAPLFIVTPIHIISTDEGHGPKRMEEIKEWLYDLFFSFILFFIGILCTFYAVHVFKLLVFYFIFERFMIDKNISVFSWLRYANVNTIPVSDEHTTQRHREGVQWEGTKSYWGLSFLSLFLCYTAA